MGLNCCVVSYRTCAPDAVSVERLAAREWRLADGTYGTLTIHRRPLQAGGAAHNLGAEIREAHSSN
eukprot:4244537-Prymnesium_polylepis.1